MRFNIKYSCEGKIVKLVKIIFLFIIFIPVAASPQEKKDIKTQRFELNEKAIWGPGMSIMQKIRNDCGKLKFPNFGDCFYSEAKKFGASKQALMFIKMTDNSGYMRDFKETGKVDVAYSFYPFRANENQLCFLVNGSPDMINIDEYNIVKEFPLNKNKIYIELKKEYPEISIWPGDRSGTDFPVVHTLPGGGQQFTFTYRLQNGCHACRLIGLANVNFNFNNEGKLLNTEVADVLKVIETKNGNIIADSFNENSKLTNVKKNDNFTISLNTNRSTGYVWELENHINNKIVKLVTKQYLFGNDMPGVGGMENWNFYAEGKGKITIKFKYLRPWEKNKPAAKKIDFKVIVE